MCIKYEASSEKDMHKSGWMVPPRPNVPRDESKPSKEEQERRMGVLLLTKSPDKEDSYNERKKNVRNQHFRQNINDYSNSTRVVSRGYGYFL